MRKILILLIALITSCTPNTTEQKQTISKDLVTAQGEEEVKKEVIISISLNSLIDAFSKRKEAFKANKKYVDKKLKVTGRVSYINEDGTLYLQVKPYGECIKCKGLPDDFLLKIEKENIVEITGTFKRESPGSIMAISTLIDCFAYKIIK